MKLKSRAATLTGLSYHWRLGCNRSRFVPGVLPLSVPMHHRPKASDEEGTEPTHNTIQKKPVTWINVRMAATV